MKSEPRVQSLSAIALGLLGSFAVRVPANAQIPVTGGTAVFTGSQIFVPDPGAANTATDVFEGSTPSRILIRTTQGNIPLNAVFESTILPTLNVSPGGTPGVGNTGNVLGTLTFRGFTDAGEPGLYTNIPTELNFQVTSGSFFGSQPFTKYQTEPFLFVETGTISTPTTFTRVSRVTDVVAVQHQPGTSSPQSQLLGNVVVPASAYNTASSGDSFSANFTAGITGGNVQIPTPPGFNDSPTVTQTPRETGELVNNGTPAVIFVPIFTSFGAIPPTIIGTRQGVPLLPQTLTVGVFVFNTVPSGRWFDPPVAESFEFEMIPSPQPVGLASRVFPGVTGTEISADSVFTAIGGFPQGVDADDRFTVSVDGVVLGEFGPGDVLNFGDYQEMLGDRLVNGEGVSTFTISAIEPGVNPENPRAFPIKLEFSTSTASFEMRAQGEGLEDSSVSLFRLPREVERLLQEKSRAEE